MIWNRPEAEWPAEPSVQGRRNIPDRSLSGQGNGAKYPSAALLECIFEPLWNNKHIANIQITLSETVGVEERGGYYDKSGALRDMVQNHMMQMLTMIAMEPPAACMLKDMRDEKVKVLRSFALCIGTRKYGPMSFGLNIAEGSAKGKRCRDTGRRTSVNPSP